MNQLSKNLLRILLPIIVLVLGFMAYGKLASLRKPPERAEVRAQITPVAVTPVSRGNEAVIIQAAGTVIPAREVTMRPQVSGQIVEMNPNLQPGSVFEEGQLLLRIDPRDYQLAVARQKANLEQARFEVIQERGRQAIAKREWELLGNELQTSEEGRDLALRKPHLERAEAALAAAESALDEAELALERTTIRAPFNALVKSENVDPGQLITTQNVIAHLTGTDRYWIQAALPVGDLSLIKLPENQEGAAALVVHETGSAKTTWEGRIVRLLGDLEEAGRMARVLVAVDNPLQGGNLPLLLGSYVQVEIQGNTMEGVFSIPPRALREGNRVWVMNADNKLEVKPVSVARLENDRVLISEGLDNGDRVVTTRIGTPVPGMLLVVSENQEGADD